MKLTCRNHTQKRMVFTSGAQHNSSCWLASNFKKKIVKTSGAFMWCKTYINIQYRYLFI
jgi:hypothetical protein